MKWETIIFSNQLKFRVTRHLAFWILFSLHFIVQNLMIGGPGEGKTSRTFYESFLHFLYFIPTYLLSTYMLIGILMPTFLFRKKYTRFVVTVALLITGSYICIYYAGVLYLHQVALLPYKEITFNENKYHAIVDGIFVSLMLLSIAAGIKLSKKWFLQQRANERLAKQKLAKELQLLKTSLHPRFLFHSLQTVQKHIDSHSAQSPSLILQLSDLLSYILYEKEHSWVPLLKELEIIRSYISLEENSLDSKITLNVQFPLQSKDKLMVPFLLLSVIENCFEYFKRSGQTLPSLTISGVAHEDELSVKVALSKHLSERSEICATDFFISSQKQLQDQSNNIANWQLIESEKQVSIHLVIPLYNISDIEQTKREALHVL